MPVTVIGIDRNKSTHQPQREIQFPFASANGSGLLKRAQTGVAQLGAPTINDDCAGPVWYQIALIQINCVQQWLKAPVGLSSRETVLELDDVHSHPLRKLDPLRANDEHGRTVRV